MTAKVLKIMNTQNSNFRALGQYLALNVRL